MGKVENGEGGREGGGGGDGRGGLISYEGERMLLYTTDSAYHCVSDVPMWPFGNNTFACFVHL